MKHSFILKRQPKSYNGWNQSSATKKANYKQSIVDSFNKYNTLEEVITEELYGLLYYFFKRDYQTDADNLSKPIWDCLRGFLFNDDYQVKLRVAGSVNLSHHDFQIFDTTGLSGDLIIDLIEAVDNEQHFVYVECGSLDYSMFKFNMQTNGN